MPTPSGLPKAGDLVRHKRSGEVLRVVERTSNGQDYGVVLEKLDRAPFPPSIARPGNPRQMMLLEAYYWLKMSGQWELLPKVQLVMEELVRSVHAANPDIPRPRVEKIVRLTLALTQRKGKSG